MKIMYGEILIFVASVHITKLDCTQLQKPA